MSATEDLRKRLKNGEPAAFLEHPPMEMALELMADPGASWWWIGALRLLLDASGTRHQIDQVARQYIEVGDFDVVRRMLGYHRPPVTFAMASAINRIAATIGTTTRYVHLFTLQECHDHLDSSVCPSPDPDCRCRDRSVSLASHGPDRRLPHREAAAGAGPGAVVVAAPAATAACRLSPTCAPRPPGALS